jgi:hypothetical protein
MKLQINLYKKTAFFMKAVFLLKPPLVARRAMHLGFHHLGHGFGNGVDVLAV